MRFKSVATVPVHFIMDGVVYDLPVGGECDIPDEKAYAIAPMGLPLVPVPEPAPAPPAPSPTKAKKEPATPAIPATPASSK